MYKKSVYSQTYSGGEFDWSTEEQGLLLGAFYYGHVLTQIPGGFIAEKYGGKWPFGLSILLTSVLTLLTAPAARFGLGYLIALRVLEGAASGGTFPIMLAMMSKWLPPQERGRLATCVNAGKRINCFPNFDLNRQSFFPGMQFGVILALSVSGVLADKVNWESVFYLFGGLGVAWFVLWTLFVFDSPGTHPRISKVSGLNSLIFH